VIYPLLNILWWNLVGQWMHFVFTHIASTYIRPRVLPRFSTTAPQWWKDSWGHSYNWYHNLTNGVPGVLFVWYYARAARDRFSDWIRNAADTVARPLVDAVRGLLGNLLYGYTKFSDWIRAIQVRVGSWVPWWTSTLAAGLDYLWNRLPGDIRDGTISWYTKFSAWYNAAISWSQSRYESVRVWVVNTGAWLVSGYNTVRAWYDSAHGWLDDFRLNTYARITARLGVTWTRAVTFFTSAGTFWYNLWGFYAADIGAFWADPLGWLYDRAEDELVRRW